MLNAARDKDPEGKATLCCKHIGQPPHRPSFMKMSLNQLNSRLFRKTVSGKQRRPLAGRVKGQLCRGNVFVIQIPAAS